MAATVDAESGVLKCLLLGRNTLDLLCDSLWLQCHQVQEVIERLEPAGLVRQRAVSGMGALIFDITPEGRAQATARLGDDERALAEAGYSRDDVQMLRHLAAGQPPPRQEDCEWGTGATRQHLWEEGLVKVGGLLRPKASITAQGRSVLESLERTAA